MEDGYTTVLKGVSLFFVHESADVVLGWAMPNQLRDATVSSFTFLLHQPIGRRWRPANQKSGQNVKVKKKTIEL